METQLFQKIGGNYKKYTLLEDSLIVETKTLSKINKFEIKLDKIGHNILYQADNSLAGIVFFWICISIPIVLLLVFILNIIQLDLLIINCILWFSLAAMNYLKRTKDNIHLVGSLAFKDRKVYTDYSTPYFNVIELEFFRNIPNEQEVLDFINNLLEVSKQYIKKHYTQIEDFTDKKEYYSLLERLEYNNIITEKELNDYKKKFELLRK